MSASTKIQYDTVDSKKLLKLYDAVDSNKCFSLYDAMDNTEFLSLYDALVDEVDPVAVARSECGELHSPLALLSQQVELEAWMEGGLELDFHSPEYAKFRMEQEDVEEISPYKEFYSWDSPCSDSNSILDISGGKIKEDSMYILPEWVTQDDAELEAIMEAAEAELQKATQTLQSQARAKHLEDEETKALMQEWNLNDRAFDPLPSAIVDPPPALANGLGPVLHLRNGGSLRSMSPSYFHGGTASMAEQLVMQVSNPVVVPSEMGATSMAVLRRMAMAGMEGMGAQAMMAMPLEDITGKGVDQLSVEHRDHSGFAQCRMNGFAALGYDERDALTLRENSSCARGSKRNKVANDELYMGLEDLAPMAMAKIEALALEGLKIQAEMADQESPCVIEPLASESNLVRAGKRLGKLPGRPPLLGDGSEEENFMSMAVSLDEWMRLDTGVCGENETEDQTLAIIAAHNTAHNERDRVLVSKKGNDRNASTGYMGQTVTLAMLVQLRDPLRCNESVGAPMMALVQAERVKVPSKQKLGRRIIASLPGRRNSEEEDDENKNPRFKIVGVTVAGLKTNPSSPAKKTGAWGNSKQLQAGSRWLVAQGMQKSTKAHPALKSKAPQVKVQPGDSLWSISTRVHGSGAKWRDLARLNPHIRNPDIIFPDTSIRTR